MAKAGKVHHWKHGWIPLDGVALARSHRRRLGLTDSGPMSAAEFEQRLQEAKARSASRRKVDTVDGVDFVSYSSDLYDPLGDDHGKPREWTPAQRKVIADTVNEVRQTFPGVKPVQFVGVDNSKGAFAITSWDGRRISVAGQTFTAKGRRQAHENFGAHGAMAGQFTGDPEAFARAVTIHELGHALEMQSDQAKRSGDQLALQRVLPTSGPGEGVIHLTPVEFGQFAPGATKRWQVDTLGGQSVYATGNKYEWFAEAFADGYINGDRATDEGKAAIKMLHEVYGGTDA